MTFVTELHAALDRPDQTDMTTSVHELVANALARLDPHVEIKRTEYFGHTFVPDLVLKWNGEDVPYERYVHLRFSVTSEPFGRDLDMLGGASPMFIGMTDTQDLSTIQWTGLETDGSLITQGPR